MYFDEVENKTPVVFVSGTRAAMTVNALATLVLGIFPGVILHFCHDLF